MEENKISYNDAGVNIEEGKNFVNKIKNLVKKTYTERVLSGIGPFGGLFDISNIGVKKPVLVSSTDGVGTKIKVAVMAGKHKGIGIDIVSHCINDIMVQGAIPIFFLDYIGCSKLSSNIMAELIEGMSEVCEETNCALIGGETAEMPDVYNENEYDLVGTIVGIADKEKIIDGSKIKEGDVLVGLPSSGLHTNGYTLARKIIFDKKKLDIDFIPEGESKKIGEILLEPHRCYYKVLKEIFENCNVSGIAHITGGGIFDNIPRILPEGIGAVIKKNSLPVPNIFKLLMEWGPVDEKEMYRVFNMGIGMVIAADKNSAEKVLEISKKYYPESNYVGEIIKGNKEVNLL